MEQRTWAITVAALLLAGSGLALATNVQGQDFERKGELADPGDAYRIEWDSEDAGTLRLSMDPASDATSPSAIVSLFEGDERLGTYTLDEDWPRLDQKVDARDRLVLVVHRTVDAEVDVLAEEGHPVDVDRVELATDNVELVSGDDEAVRTQIALDREDPFANLALTFEGDAEDLEVEVLNEADETMLEATAPRIDTREGQALSASVSPDAFETGSVLVRVTADTLNGTLGLDIQQLAVDNPHVVEADEDAKHDEGDAGDDEPAQANRTAEEPDDGQENDTEKRETADTREEQSRDSSLRKITDLTPGDPVAVEVPAGVEALYVVGEEDCATAIAFDADDQLAGVAMLDRDEGAQSWDEGEDEEDHNASDKVVVSLPVEAPGEHVVLLEDSHDDGALYMDVDEPVDTRVLDTIEVEGQISSDDDRMIGSSNGTNTSAEEALEGGLIGFSWRSDGVDIEREVRLVGPDGEALYEAHGASAGPIQVTTDGHQEDPLVGSAGDYTIETDSESAIDRGMSYTLVTYER